MVATRNLLLIILSLVLLQGCVGGKVPSERILRIQNEAPADYVVRKGEPLIVMDDLEAFPVLERTAVLGGNGNVLTPSTRLYWEGPPAAIATANLASGLNARQGFTIVWPSRSRLRHDARLTGRVEAFEVRFEPEKAMIITISFSLWSEFGKQLIATKTISSKQTISKVQPDDMAKAASAAMQEVIKQTGDWLITTGLPVVKTSQDK